MQLKFIWRFEFHLINQFAFGAQQCVEVFLMIFHSYANTHAHAIINFSLSHIYLLIFDCILYLDSPCMLDFASIPHHCQTDAIGGRRREHKSKSAYAISTMMYSFPDTFYHIHMTTWEWKRSKLYGSFIYFISFLLSPSHRYLYAVRW